MSLSESLSESLPEHILEDFPEELLDPVSFLPLTDPIALPCGHVLNRNSISRDNTCPSCRDLLPWDFEAATCAPVFLVRNLANAEIKRRLGSVPPSEKRPLLVASSSPLAATIEKDVPVLREQPPPAEMGPQPGTKLGLNPKAAPFQPPAYRPPATVLCIPPCPLPFTGTGPPQLIETGSGNHEDKVQERGRLCQASSSSSLNAPPEIPSHHPEPPPAPTSSETGSILDWQTEKQLRTEMPLPLLRLPPSHPHSFFGTFAAHQGMEEGGSEHPCVDALQEFCDRLLQQGFIQDVDTVRFPHGFVSHSRFCLHAWIVVAFQLRAQGYELFRQKRPKGQMQMVTDDDPKPEFNVIRWMSFFDK